MDVVNEKWRYLIVLDACRYDYFKKLYKRYDNLSRGKLYKVKSKSNNTLNWISRWEGDHKDIIYVSANPFINSKGKTNGIKPSEVFYKVIDVWDYGWDDNFQTVLPDKVNEAALEVMSNFPEKRIIVHYLQPHAPFISISNDIINKIRNNNKKTIMNMIVDKMPLVPRWYMSFFISKILSSFGIYQQVYNFFMGTGMRKSYYKLFLDFMSEHKIKTLYEKNLDIVLLYVNELVGNMKGKIIITSDHGELLGEHGIYEHPIFSWYEEQITVPLLKIRR